MNGFQWLVLLSPVLMLGAKWVSKVMPSSLRLVINVHVGASVIAAVSALVVLGYALSGVSSELVIWSIHGLGLAFRVDTLSAVMSSMIGVLGVFIFIFSRNYLDGEPRQSLFFGRLALSLASAMLLVSSGNLATFFVAWVMTSLTLHRLLVFYPDRYRGIVAARKKFIVARIGDFVILVAFLMIYLSLGTGSFSAIFEAAFRPSLFGWQFEWIASFLCVGAILKSAQIPFHGWLLEVMETPTPVSALLHAGILNAGVFLVVRFATVIGASEFAPVILVIFGGVTALFASSVLLTQSAVKTILAYSSSAHMGFMLLVCGMGAYSAAILHLVAHSFYKAYAFFSTGTAVAGVQGLRRPSPKLLAPWRGSIGSLVLATGLYFGLATLFHIPLYQLAFLLVGSVVILGVSMVMAPVLRSSFSVAKLLAVLGMAVGVVVSFFSLETLMHGVLQSVLPDKVMLSFWTFLVFKIVLIGFVGVILFQLLGVKIRRHSFLHRFYIHLKNGFYINAWVDRIIRSDRVKGVYK